MKKAMNILGIIIFTITFILTGCSNTNKNNDIVVALTDDTGGDAMDATTYNGARASHGAVYEPLVEYGEKGKIVPALANSWEINEGGKEYIFHLRDDVVFSDKTPFNAEAVKFSLERAVLNEGHKSLELYQKLDNVEIVDTYTVKLKFKEIASQILLELSQARPFRMMSPTAVEPIGDINGTFVEPIGTGPWKLDSYEQGNKTTFLPNENYWQDIDTNKRLIFKVIKDAQARVLALQNGEIDIAGGEMSTIPMENYALFKNDKYTIESRASTMSYFIVFNQENKFLADVNIRKAINYGTDTSKLYNNDTSTVQGLYQKTVKFINDNNQPSYIYDKQKAIQLLEDSGFIKAGDYYTKDNELITLDLIIQVEEFPEWKQMSEVFQAQMKEIGIKVNIAIQEKATYYDTLWKNRTFDLMIYRTYTDAQVPYRFMTSLFYEKDTKKAIAFSDERVTALLDKIGASADEQMQQVYFDEIFELLYTDAMTLPIYYKNETFIVSNKIENFTFSTIEDSPVKWHLLSKKN